MTTSEEAQPAHAAVASSPPIRSLDDWPVPPPLRRVQVYPHIWMCPYVPLPLPRSGGMRQLEWAWNALDGLSWEIPESRRLEILEDQLKPHVESWWDILRMDRTYIFERRIQRAKARHWGLVIGIRGPQGSGKSVLGQMAMARAIDTVPRVIFMYRDLRNETASRTSNEALGIQVDEDLTATGSDSGVLMTHVRNAAQTNRKGELWLICTGVNLSFEGWGDTLALRLEPWGYNEFFQATRFAMFSPKDNLLGLAAIQRFHRPTDPVYYYSEPGIWSEYVGRASNFSREVIRTGGVNPGTDPILQGEAYRQFKAFVSGRYGNDPPAVKTLEFDYIDQRLPADSVGFMDRVISKVLFDLKRGRREKDDEPDEKPIPVSSEGWLGLRERLQEAVTDFRYAREFAYYYVPDEPSISYAALVETFRPAAEDGKPLLPASLGKAIRERRRLLTPQQLAVVGEDFVASQLESPATAHGIEGRPDILLHAEGMGREIAVNVKTSLTEHVDKPDETSPEHTYAPYAVAVLLVPRMLSCRLFHITGPVTHLNSRVGGSLVAIDGLREGILKLISEKVKIDRGGDS